MALSGCRRGPVRRRATIGLECAEKETQTRQANTGKAAASLPRLSFIELAGRARS
jgi:hypothetical protein